jgi:hypothetical protein
MIEFLLILLLLCLFPRSLNVIGVLVWIVVVALWWHWPA